MPIKIDLNSIYKEGDKIFGNIYFEKEDIVFPENQWLGGSLEIEKGTMLLTTRKR